MFCELRRFIFSIHKFLLLNFFIYNEIISLQYINYIDSLMRGIFSNSNLCKYLKYSNYDIFIIVLHFNLV